MTDRERLIELKINFVENFDCGDCKPSNNKCRKCLSEKEADYFLEHGVTVLPCKVGDTVWRIVRDGEPHITRDEVRDMYFADDMTLCVELVGGRVTFTEKFGKTVFLSREEAEKALREMEGKKDG